MRQPKNPAILQRPSGSRIRSVCLVAAFCCMAAFPAALSAGDGNYHYALEVQGSFTGYFTGAGGIGSESEIAEQKVVSEKGVQTVLKLPGKLKWLDVTLSRGMTANTDLWDWRKMVEDGNVKNARKNFCIVMYDASLSEIARWNFVNGWPAMIDAPSHDNETAFAVENLVIAHEGCSREGTSVTTTIAPETTTTVEPETTTTTSEPETTSTVEPETTTTVEPDTTTTTSEPSTSTSILENADSSCGFTLSPAALSISAAGAVGEIYVTASKSDCLWSCQTTDDWISVISPAADTAGSGTASVSIAQNTDSPARTGTLFIAGQSCTVRQDGAPSAPTTTIQPPPESTTTSSAPPDDNQTGEPALGVDKRFHLLASGQTTVRITINNTGTGTLQWKAREPEYLLGKAQPWLSLDAAGGNIGAGSAAVLTAAVDRSRLQPGPCLAALPITSNGGAARVLVFAWVPFFSF